MASQNRVALAFALALGLAAPAAGLINLGAFLGAGDPRDVEVVGGLAYVADGVSGLRIVDVSTPSLPATDGFFPEAYAAFDLDLEGDLLYVGAAVSGLGLVQVFDVSIPDAPLPVGDTFHLGLGIFEDIEAEAGSLLGLVPIFGAYQGLDVTDPNQPEGTGAFGAPVLAQGVEIEGGLAYLAVSPGRIQIVDASLPTRPGVIGTSTATPQRVDAAGGYAYVAEGGPLRVVDVSDPEGVNPVVATVPLAAALDVEVRSGRAYVLDGTVVRVYDVSTPTTPVELGSLDVGPEVASEIEVVGPRLYVAGDSLRIVAVSSPATPSVLGTFALALTDIEVAGGFLYGSRNGDGLRIIDISNPALPVETGTLPLPDARDLALRAGFAYVVEDDRLVVVDVGVPTAPVQRGEVDLGAAAFSNWDVEVAAGVVYVAKDASIFAFDASDPDSPRLLGITGPASGEFEIRRGLTYTADFQTSELAIFEFGPEYVLEAPAVPALGGVGRLLLGAVLLAAGVAARRRRRSVIHAWLCTLCFLSAPASHAEFEGLGFLPGGSASRAHCVSGDGGLGMLPGHPVDLSGDGAVVAGCHSATLGTAWLCARARAPPRARPPRGRRRSRSRERPR